MASWISISDGIRLGGFKWARRETPLYDDTMGLVDVTISMVYIELANVMKATI
jgi:GTP-sensing pleiotropic transcriptional regulator CodY